MCSSHGWIHAASGADSIMTLQHSLVHGRSNPIQHRVHPWRGSLGRSSILQDTESCTASCKISSQQVDRIICFSTLFLGDRRPDSGFAKLRNFDKRSSIAAKYPLKRWPLRNGFVDRATGRKTWLKNKLYTHGPDISLIYAPVQEQNYETWKDLLSSAQTLSLSQSQPSLHFSK